MEWEGVDGLRSCMMSGSGSFSFNSITYANKLSWNRHECKGKRNPASEPPSHLTWPVIVSSCYGPNSQEPRINGRQDGTKGK